MCFKTNIFVMPMVVLFLANMFCMASDSEFESDYKRATDMRESKATDGFEDLVKDIQSKWFRDNKSIYGTLIAHTLKSWVSACKQSNTKVPIDQIHRYATNTLSTYDPEKPDNINIETEFELVSILYEQYSYVKNNLTDENWELSRLEGNNSWLHAWQRLEKAIDKNFDPNVVPEENISPPEGVFGFPGMLPEQMKDSLLREKYKKAIQENQAKIEIRNEQLKLRSLKKRYTKIIEKYLISMYSIAPFNSNELSQYLKEYKLNKETTYRILDSVTKNIEKQNQESSLQPK